MYVTPEKFLNAGKAGVEAALAVAHAQFAAVEKLAALNMAAAKSTFEETTDHIKSVFEAKDPQELVKINSAFAQPVLEKAVAYARNVYDVTSQAQTQVAKVVETQSVEVNKAMASAIDSLAKNAPVGSDAAVNAMKSALAAFNSAYDGMSKVAKQAAEVVEVNFANAASAARSNGKRRAA